MVTNVFAKLFGTQGLRDTIHDALGPRACWPVLKRRESDEPSPAGMEILIRIPIDLKGEDLGDDVLPWKTWCLGLVQASVPGAP